MEETEYIEWHYKVGINNYNFSESIYRFVHKIYIQNNNNNKKEEKEKIRFIHMQFMDCF